MITVSKTVHSAMKRDLEKKRKRVAKEINELKQMEAAFKSVKPIKLGKR